MKHVLPDVLPRGLCAVICGTAAGEMSASLGAYYAHPTNRFWKVLQQVGLTPQVLKPSDFGILFEYGLGLTDIAKTVSGVDASVPSIAFDVPSFASSIRACCPGIVAFNGKKAARTFYGLRPRDLLEYGAGLPVLNFPPTFVLPSTSGSAARFWDLNWWQQFAHKVRAECNSASNNSR